MLKVHLDALVLSAVCTSWCLRPNLFTALLIEWMRFTNTKCWEECLCSCGFICEDLFFFSPYMWRRKDPSGKFKACLQLPVWRRLKFRLENHGSFMQQRFWDKSDRHQLHVGVSVLWKWAFYDDCRCASVSFLISSVCQQLDISMSPAAGCTQVCWQEVKPCQTCPVVSKPVLTACVKSVCVLKGLRMFLTDLFELYFTL